MFLPSGRRRLQYRNRIGRILACVLLSSQADLFCKLWQCGLENISNRLADKAIEVVNPWHNTRALYEVHTQAPAHNFRQPILECSFPLGVPRILNATVISNTYIS
jgi:hypothetical protein